MKIATWNVNGIKARIDAAQTWLKTASPDIALLQETKCVDDAFPRLEFEAMGYNIATHGQKGFNGVALLSKLPFDEVAPRLAGDPDDVQARYLEAVVSVPSGVLRLVTLPNGSEITSAPLVGVDPTSRVYPVAAGPRTGAVHRIDTRLPMASREAPSTTAMRKGRLGW